MSNSKKVIPKIIWLLWFQGQELAPFIVKKCFASWIRENPGWKIIILDKETIHQYIDLDLPEEKLARLTLTKQSNLIRLQLLSKYGGVWADATAYCMKPLDDWLEEYTRSGFFAFEKPGVDRMMDNWFLASEKANPIIEKLRANYVSFFLKNTFFRRGKNIRRWRKLLGRILNINTRMTQYWLSPTVIHTFGIYPYFIFHYLFNQLIATDSECREIWGRTRKYSAAGPLHISKAGLLNPLPNDLQKEIDNANVPMYKLSWRFDFSKYAAQTILFYVLEGRSDRATAR
jgi:hypothetical protein